MKNPSDNIVAIVSNDEFFPKLLAVSTHITGNIK